MRDGLARILLDASGMSELPSPWLMVGMLVGAALAGLFHAVQYGLLG